MRVVFLDGSPLDYTVLTPSESPLGGMQSALCYLALALAERGHRVTLLSKTTRPGKYRGVDCLRIESVAPRVLNEFDVIVSISTGSVNFRAAGVNRPIILWTGHDINQGAVQSLRDWRERHFWDKIVLVSEWQASRYVEKFLIPAEKIKILRNAVAPTFIHQTRSRPYFFASGRPPVLAYSSTPFRGLEVLLQAFPLIRALVPGCEMKVYSGMSVYQTPPESDAFQPLYQRCRAIEGATYVGSVSQTALADEMSNVDVFAYPSTFAETSCIALMEAMASACMIVSSKLGALPETSAGFARLCRASGGAEFARLYARFTAKTINEARREPDKWSSLLDAQRRHALEHYSWSARATEWEELLLAVAPRPVKAMASCGS
jgi:glycosyltransferase involved in cell wall biosynthesis